ETRVNHLRPAGVRSLHSGYPARYCLPTARERQPSTMDAVTAVMNDHRVLEDLFEQLRADDEHRVVLLAEVTARLTAHSRAEERGSHFEETRSRELRRAGIDDTLTKEDLYIRAQRAGIAGRSGMTKGELIRALLATRK